MRTTEITIETKKLDGGYYKIIVTDKENDKVETFIERDVIIIHALRLIDIYRNAL